MSSPWAGSGIVLVVRGYEWKIEESEWGGAGGESESGEEAEGGEAENDGRTEGEDLALQLY